jgi:TonB family protein
MNTAAARDSWAGRVIDGRFSLLQWLGSSDWSHVFLTELEGQGSQRAAIKLMSAYASDSGAHLSRWQVATTLSHPHLMRIFHTGRCQINTAPLIYAVMEYAEEDLAQILPERALTPDEAGEMLHPVLDALSYLHGKGFVHGHLKPSNITVVDNQVKLSCDSLHRLGEPGKSLRAPRVYAAPEVVNGAISPAADAWSLGVTLVEALTQQLPAWGNSVPREAVLPKSIPQPFSEIAQECLRSDPALRCTLTDIQSHLEPTRSLPEPAIKTLRGAPAKFRVTALTAAALVVFALIVALRLGSHQTRPSLPTAKQRPVAAVEPVSSQARNPVHQTPKGTVVKGAVSERVLPDVPRKASGTIQGKVKVRIRVTADSSGEVSNAKFDSAGPSKYFANLALQSARQWKFKPAQRDGQAVSSVWMLRFQFGRTATEVFPVEVSP